MIGRGARRALVGETKTMNEIRPPIYNLQVERDDESQPPSQQARHERGKF